MNALQVAGLFCVMHVACVFMCAALDAELVRWIVAIAAMAFLAISKAALACARDAARFRRDWNRARGATR